MKKTRSSAEPIGVVEEQARRNWLHKLISDGADEGSNLSRTVGAVVAAAVASGRRQKPGAAKVRNCQVGFLDGWMGCWKARRGYRMSCLL